MNIIKLLPRELHALEINYIKMQLADMPVVKVKHIRRNGKTVTTLFLNGHQTAIDSERGSELVQLANERHTLIRELAVLQSAWDATYFEKVPKLVLPHPVKRTFIGYGGRKVQMDRDFFDSLTAESNPNFLEYKKYFYNGVYYRSKGERDIARTYTDLGIEFKYEPEVLLNSSKKSTYSDFVCWDRITQSCFFHEHMGMNSLADYAHRAITAMSNYTSAGVLPNVDIIYTFEDDDFYCDPELTVAYVSLLLQNRLRNAEFPEAGN